MVLDTNCKGLIPQFDCPFHFTYFRAVSSTGEVDNGGTDSRNPPAGVGRSSSRSIQSPFNSIPRGDFLSYAFVGIEWPTKNESHERSGRQSSRQGPQLIASHSGHKKPFEISVKMIVDKRHERKLLFYVGMKKKSKPKQVSTFRNNAKTGRKHE